MSIRAYVFFILLGCFCIALSACSEYLTPEVPTVELQPTQTSIPIELPSLPVVVTIIPRPAFSHQDVIIWERRWLQSDPCAPPCWEHIIPNTTSYTEVFDLLMLQSYVTEIENITYRDSTVIAWTAGFGGGSVIVHPPALTIHTTQLNFSLPILLGDIQASFGNPSHVLAAHSMEVRGNGLTEDAFAHTYFVLLLYESHGFLLHSWASSTQPHITADLKLSGVQFFDPATPLAEISAIGEQYQAAFVPWQSSQSFTWYCNQAEEYTDPCA